MLSRAQILVGAAAGIGGSAPNLVNLAQGFISNPPSVPGLFFYIGVAIFFLLGAAVALIFSETDFRKAFFLGVSLPAFIAAAQSGPGPRLPIDGAKPVAGITLFIASAYAQPVAPPLGTQKAISRSISVESHQPCVGCEIWFLNKAGRPIEKRYVPHLKGKLIFDVPNDATQFGIWNDKINPQIWELPTGSPKDVVYEFSYEYNRWNDLKRGLGDYNVRPYDGTIRSLKQ